MTWIWHISTSLLRWLTPQLQSRTSNICHQTSWDWNSRQSAAEMKLKGCRLLFWSCVSKVTQRCRWHHTVICASSLISTELRAPCWRSKSSPATHPLPARKLSEPPPLPSNSSNTVSLFWTLSKLTRQCFAFLKELSLRRKLEVVCKTCYMSVMSVILFINFSIMFFGFVLTWEKPNWSIF